MSSWIVSHQYLLNYGSMFVALCIAARIAELPLSGRFFKNCACVMLSWMLVGGVCVWLVNSEPRGVSAVASIVVLVLSVISIKFFVDPPQEEHLSSAESSAAEAQDFKI